MVLRGLGSNSLFESMKITESIQCQCNVRDPSVHLGCWLLYQVCLTIEGGPLLVGFQKNLPLRFATAIWIADRSSHHGESIRHVNDLDLLSISPGESTPEDDMALLGSIAAPKLLSSLDRE